MYIDNVQSSGSLRAIFRYGEYLIVFYTLGLYYTLHPVHGVYYTLRPVDAFNLSGWWVNEYAETYVYDTTTNITI